MQLLLQLPKRDKSFPLTKKKKKEKKENKHAKKFTKRILTEKVGSYKGYP